MFILKDQQGRRTILYTAEAVEARHPERLRDTGRRIAGFREVEGAGTNRSKISLSIADAARADGHAVSRHRVHGVPATSAEVAKRLRVLRAEDEAALAAKDAEITALREQLQGLRSERKQIATDAWGRAEKLATIGDLMEQAASLPGGGF